MPIRRILVPLSGRFAPHDPESLDRAALEIGLRVGERLQAHVDVLCVVSPPPAPEQALAAWIPQYGIDQLLDMMEKEGAARRRRARKAYDAAIAAHAAPTGSDTPGFGADYLEHPGEVHEAVAAHGRLSDLIVLANSPERWRWPYRPILDAALNDTGRPLLVATAQAPETLVRRVAVAWNGSVEAARAVSAMLEFVAPGAEVLVLSVDEDGPTTPGPEAVSDYLRWHGVPSTAETLPGDARTSGDVIIDRALAAGCDLLAMGACIHSLAHRAVFGSMTETALAGARMPLLLST